MRQAVSISGIASLEILNRRKLLASAILSTVAINLFSSTRSLALAPTNENMVMLSASGERWVRPNAALGAWCYIMGCPKGLDFIVGLDRRDGTNKRDGSPIWHNLVTYRALKMMPTESVRFKVPHDYKRAADMGAFLFSDHGNALEKEDVDGLFQKLR